MIQWNATARYHQMSVNTASPETLVVMLYEGTIRFLTQAIDGIKINDLERKRESIDRALAIVQHLQGTLDFERGSQIAGDLHNIYGYMTSQIVQGSTRLDTRPLEETIGLLNTLVAAWRQIAAKEQQRHVPPPALVGTGGPSRVRLHG